MAIDTFMVYAGIYGNVDDAVDDYDAVKKLASAEAQREFRKLRGTFKFTIDLDGLREDRKW